MKPLKRALTLSLLLLTLTACEDPLDRMQGEPGENGTAVGSGEGGVRTDEAPNEAAGETEENH